MGFQMLNGALLPARVSSARYNTFTYCHTGRLGARLTPTWGKVSPASRKKYPWRLCLSKYWSVEPDKYSLSGCRSSHSWRSHDIAARERGFSIWVQRRTACPEVEDLGMEDHVDACVCVVNPHVTVSAKRPMGRRWGGELGGSPGQKGELAEQGKGSKGKSPVPVLSASSKRGGGKPPSTKCDLEVWGPPSLCPLGMLSLSLNAMLTHLPVHLSHAATKLFKPRIRALLAPPQRLRTHASELTKWTS